jgi:hypothetical protein
LILPRRSVLLERPSWAASSRWMPSRSADSVP